MMSRLTKNNKGDYYYPECIERCDGAGTSEKCNECDFCYEICKKLGEYEDLEEKMVVSRQHMVDKIVERLKEVSYERFGNTGVGGELVVNLDDAIKVIRTRELNCDETQEIRTVLKHMHEILDEAIETNACGNENELSRMVEAYLPNIEQSYKYFIERMMGVKHE